MDLSNATSQDNPLATSAWQCQRDGHGF
jgi:hypothetical protein